MSNFKKTNFRSAVKQDVEKRASEKEGYNYLNIPKSVHMYKYKEGKAEFDILPYIVTSTNHPDHKGDIAIKDSLWYKLPYKIHRNVGVNNDVVICPTTFGLPCPICEIRKEKAAEGEDWEKRVRG